MAARDGGTEPGEILVVPAELCRMADVGLQVSLDTWTARGLVEPGPAPDPRAAGDTPGGRELVADHDAAGSEASAALEILAGVLERDVDALYRSAFAYGASDEEAASRVARALPEDGS